MVFLLGSCSGKCRYKTFGEFSNPSATFRVVKFYNWCGFTSSNNLNFSLLGTNDSIENRNKIIFVAGSTVGDELEKDTTTRIKWISDSAVLITYDSTLKVFTRRSEANGVAIRYELK